MKQDGGRQGSNFISASGDNLVWSVVCVHACCLIHNVRSSVWVYTLKYLRLSLLHLVHTDPFSMSFPHSPPILPCVSPPSVPPWGGRQAEPYSAATCSQTHLVFCSMSVNFSLIWRRRRWERAAEEGAHRGYDNEEVDEVQHDRKECKERGGGGGEKLSCKTCLSRSSLHWPPPLAASPALPLAPLFPHYPAQPSPRLLLRTRKVMVGHESLNTPNGSII